MMTLSKKVILESVAIIVLSALVGVTVNGLSENSTSLLRPRFIEAASVPGGGEQVEPEPEGEPDLPAIDIKLAKALFNCSLATFVDARRENQYKEGHISGAISLPNASFLEKLPEFEALYPGVGPIITYCEGKDCELGYLVAQKLIEVGYKDVFIMHPDGYWDWEEDGCPIDREE